MSSSTSIPASLVPAYAAARDVCRRHARSFYFASHFLPSPKREHAYAIYAFCRLLDDAADVAGSASRLDAFAAWIDRAYDHASITIHEPGIGELFKAFCHTAHACDIPRSRFLDLVEGCRMDLAPRRFQTWTELERYCYHVAGVVGLIMCDVFGVKSPEAHRHAVAMGNAMQLTNILRDVREDMDRGHIYLPQEDLDRFGVSEVELLSRRSTQAMRELVYFEIARARALYHFGSRGLCAIPRDGSRQTASVMAVVYAGILDEIDAHHGDVFAGRASLSILQKLVRIPKAIKLSGFEVGDDVPDVFANTIL